MKKNEEFPGKVTAEEIIAQKGVSMKKFIVELSTAFMVEAENEEEAEKKLNDMDPGEREVAHEEAG